MLRNVGAVLYKNFLLRKSSVWPLLNIVLFPPMMMAFINYYLPHSKPVLFNPVASFGYYPSPGTSHDYKLYYQPNLKDTRSVMEMAGKSLGYKPANIRAAKMDVAPDDAVYGVDCRVVGDYMNFDLFPRYSVWPLTVEQLVKIRYTDYVEDLLHHQFSIDSSFIVFKGGSPATTISLISMDEVVRKEADLYGLVMFTVFFVLLLNLGSDFIGGIVDEKATGAKELMRIMGVSDWESCLAKLLEGMVLFSIPLCLILIIIYVPLNQDSAVVHTVNPMYFIFVLTLGMIPIFIMLFWLACFFENPNVAGLLVAILVIVAFSTVGMSHLISISEITYTLLCLNPFYAFLDAVRLFYDFDSLDKPVRWREDVSVHNGNVLLEIVLMMLVDTVIFAVLAWYQAKVSPGKFGIPEPYGFFLKKSYWTQNKVTSKSQALASDDTSTEGGIKVTNLRKVFESDGKTIVAVDDVTMEVPKGQITVLLGHNGAGKSTTMSIITGLIPATSGTVKINGHDVTKDLEKARRSLGLCPQQDLLFRGLNPMQILTFFGMVKGLSRGEALAESRDLLKRMKMEHKKSTISENLSGGMKRKIHLGIAIIGGSKVLVLDEPTSGVDPELRREISDLLLSYRGDKTILITTHIMEEADAISDQIVILDKGKVVCAGTSMDLKLKYGTGYTLSVVVPDKTGKGDAILNAVKSSVPGSTFKARNGFTLTFQLPEVATPKFPALFALLETMKGRQGVVSYSVSISSLEDVFIRVRAEEKSKMDSKVENLDEVDASPNQALKGDDGEGKNITSRFLMLGKQFIALFWKKSLQLWRSLAEYLIFCLFPIVLILIMHLASSKISNMKEDHQTDVTSLNASIPILEATEVLVGFDPECRDCKNIADTLTEAAEEVGFSVTVVKDVEQATRDLFYENYHRFSKNLAASIYLVNRGANIYFVKPIMSAVAINLVDNAILRTTSLFKNGAVRFAIDLYFVKRDVQPDNELEEHIEHSLKPETNVPVLAGIQAYFYMSALIRERASGAKGLQLMAVPVYIYWLSHIVFDFLTFIPYIIVVLVIYATTLGDPLFNNIGAIILPLVLWGSSMIMISYLITFFVLNKMNAFAIACLLHVAHVSLIYEIVKRGYIAEWWAYLYPSNLWRLHCRAESGFYLVILLFYCILLFILIVLIDTRIFGRIVHSIASLIRPVDFTPKGEVDSDVLQEEERASSLMSGQPENVRQTIVVSKLRRWFGCLKVNPAVRGVSFCVNPGECFGLLGVNGAGKSTTFNMLTGRLPLSSGDAAIRNQHLNSFSSRSKYLDQIGYCPQTAAILPKLTGLEMLELFARLRGLSKEKATNKIEYLLGIMDLKDSENQRCVQYSGGMERKLSTAIAFLWDAPVVMLDEPTSGVDPVSRRCIWEAITDGQKNGQAIVFTSHSMGECEVVCSRLAIMVDGSFRCVGETITLKEKFGKGYSVLIKMGRASPAQVSELKSAVMEAFSGCSLTEDHHSILGYRVADDDTSWETLFKNLENLKTRFRIFESYTASETTLEEIFLSFADPESKDDTQQKEEVISIV